MYVIECEICGSWTVMDELPKNKYCPICCSGGSLFVQQNPSEEQKKAQESGMPQAEKNEPQPVVYGRWIETEHGFVCSECEHFIDGYYMTTQTPTEKECPNCGARMDGDNHDARSL